jgi:hypothetical protein
MPTQLQVGFDTILERSQAQLFQTHALTASKRLREIGQGRSPPYRECRAERALRGLGGGHRKGISAV